MDRHGTLPVTSSVQNLRVKVFGYLIKSRRHKLVYMKKMGEKLTTSPKVHFGEKHPITELKLRSGAPLTAIGKYYAVET